jgi:arylsulfatase A-like enzyme
MGITQATTCVELIRGTMPSPATSFNTTYSKIGFFMRIFHNCNLFLVLALFIALSSSYSANAEQKPNFLFLFADDFTYDALGSLGKVDIETPNLDRLAAKGVLFSHAYNMGSFSGAVCVASRNMLLTGRSVWRAEKLSKSTEQERQAGRLWPQLLKQVGYDTYMTGKWHIQAKPELSFDVAKHVRPGMPGTVELSYNRPLDGQPDLWSPFNRSIGGFWEGGKHWSEVAADDAIEFINTAKSKSNPFFMYVAFNAPHDPRQSPSEFVSKYPLSRIALPASYLPEYPYKDSIGCDTKLRDEKLAPFPRTEHSVKVHRAEYFSIITHLDQQIGRILDALENSGKANNTYIFFTADHGLAVGQHGLLGKQNLYDHSMRVPFLVVGPTAAPGTRISSPIDLQDVMPTTLEMAGAKQPETCEFNSFLSQLTDLNAKPKYSATYGAYLELQRCVIVDGWKLIVYPKVNVKRLYHLATDPEELHDVAGESQNKPKIDQMLARLRELQQQFDDSLVLQ